MTKQAPSSPARRRRPAPAAPAAVAQLAAAAALGLAGACAAGGAETGPIGARGEAIQMGTAASAYPEAAVVTADGFVTCSGVVLAPRVVLTAGHCASHDKSYDVIVPFAGGQTAHGSDHWTPFTGKAATSPDVRLVFLDTPVTLAAYPAIAASPAPAGAAVVDIGRALNGAINQTDYVSPPVTLGGVASDLGFPFNYKAQPDISEDGDSGGPIEAPGDPSHTVLAIVDTDTIEQSLQVPAPIDLFARVDLVHDDLVAQIVAHGGIPAPAASSPPVTGGEPAASSPSSCEATGTRRAPSSSNPAAALLAFALALRAARRARPA
jgi:hypothetical protein